MPTRVVIPAGPMSRRVCVQKVHSILSNRVKGNEEQYLVRWEADSSSASSKPPLSWHSIQELARCLEQVQEYLVLRDESAALSAALPQSKKRKHPDTETEFDKRPSPVPVDQRLQQSSLSISRSSSVSSSSSLLTVDVYNGVLDADQHGFIFCKSDFSSNVPQIEISQVPTKEMMRTAQSSRVDHANILIRAEYTRRLQRVPGKKIYLVNVHDIATPSLRFKYIPDYVLREGVYKADLDTQVGCQQCSPHMGRGIGCEYTKKCDCLEYAAVNEGAITDPQMMREYKRAKAIGASLKDFPKRFPYYAEGTRRERAGALVPFYLNSRRPIYECNDKCRCGPHCRNKNVQFGRTVELEIFKSKNRGWGLRCKQSLYEGQFIDTYRGEIITDAEATRREEAAQSKTKASYLYSLDKFAESEGLKDEDLYVVDGEFMGGPTKFMNHSCEPNCRQYTVSYNKHDPRVYDIAFFACRDIPAGEELTFDYLDKEEEEEGEPIEHPGKDTIPCLCGARKCRKWLWT